MKRVRSVTRAAAVAAAVSLVGAGCSRWSGFAAPHPGQVRELPDTPSRKLVAVEGEGHTFGGHRDELFERVEAGLDWIVGAQSCLSAMIGSTRVARQAGM